MTRKMTIKEALSLCNYTCPTYGGKFRKETCEFRKQLTSSIMDTNRLYTECKNCEGPLKIDPNINLPKNAPKLEIQNRFKRKRVEPKKDNVALYAVVDKMKLGDICIFTPLEGEDIKRFNLRVRSIMWNRTHQGKGKWKIRYLANQVELTKIKYDKNHECIYVIRWYNYLGRN